MVQASDLRPGMRIRVGGRVLVVVEANTLGRTTLLRLRLANEVHSHARQVAADRAFERA